MSFGVEQRRSTGFSGFREDWDLQPLSSINARDICQRFICRWPREALRSSDCRYDGFFPPNEIWQTPPWENPVTSRDPGVGLWRTVEGHWLLINKHHRTFAVRKVVTWDERHTRGVVLRSEMYLNLTVLYFLFTVSSFSTMQHRTMQSWSMYVWRPSVPV